MTSSAPSPHALPGPLRILSDLHLGHGASRIQDAEAIAPLAEGAGTIVCNGDTWQELALEFRERGRQLLDQWRKVVSSRGAKLVLLPGNHDPGSFDQPFLDLADGAVFVSHGDCVFPEGAPWSRMLGKRRDEVDRLWREAGESTSSLEGRIRLAGEVARALNPPRHPPGRSLPARIWDAATPPSRAWQMLRAWTTFPTETARFLERFRPQARVFVGGHFHRAGVWRRGDRTIINTGSFMPPGAAWCVDLHDDRLEVRRVRQRGTAFAAGAVVRTLGLQPQPAPA